LPRKIQEPDSPSGLQDSYLCSEYSAGVCQTQSYLAEGMAFSEDNQNWIREEIRRAINHSGWKTVANWLRYWGILGIFITVFVALLAIVTTLGIFTTNRISQESEFRGGTQVRLTNIETRLGGIEASLLALRATQAANQPTDKKNIAEAKAILNAAIQSAIKLPPNVVERSGKAFIDAASKEPAAWDAAQAFLDYRSVLNVPSMPVGRITREFTTHYTTDNLLNMEKAALSVLGATDAANAAQLRHINGPDMNQGIPTQPSFLIYENATFQLDTMFLRGVIFRDSRIIYKGGPIVLQGVYFINCTFAIERQPAGQSLANAILSSGQSVTFKSG